MSSRLLGPGTGTAGSNGATARRDRVRYITPAKLNLERVYEQNRQRVQKRDGVKPLEPTPGPVAKGKPRLLLMGQRR
jgi:Ras-related GTP-binding protein C/D